MATNYPTSLDTGSTTLRTDITATTELDDVGFYHDEQHVNAHGAVIAVETKLGVGSSDASAAGAGTVLVHSGSGSTGWSAAATGVTSVGTLSSLTVSGDVTVDTDTLHVDSTNNRVGIGTTSPAEPLHVATTSGDAYLRQENGTATTYLGPDSANTGLFGTSSAHDVRFITNNTERVRIDSSGNVGIGTTSPSYALDVSGDIHIQNAAPYLIFTDTDTNAESRISAASGVGSMFIEADYNNEVADTNIIFRSDGTERMRINSSGNVGIGITSPSYALDVSGSIRSSYRVRIESDQNEQLRLEGTTTAARPYMAFYNYNGSAYVRRGYLGYPGAGSSTANIQLVADNGDVNIAPELRINSGPILSDPSSANELRVTTAHGYIDIGPKNTGYCHIYTDRTGGFYFNEHISADGGSTIRGTLNVSNTLYLANRTLYFGDSNQNDYVQYSDSAQGAMGGRFSFFSDGAVNNSQLVGGTAIFLRDQSATDHDNYQDSTSEYNVITAVNSSANSGNNWVDATLILEDNSTTAHAGMAAHADASNYAPIWRSTTSGGEGYMCRTNTEGGYARILASAFTVNSVEAAKQEIVDAPPLLQRFRDYVGAGHHTKQFRRKDVANPAPAYEQKHALIERDHGKEAADAWLEERTWLNIWTRTDGNWLELDKMQNGVEFTEFGVVIEEFGPAFPEVASWEANEDGTAMIPVGLDLSSAVGFLMRLVEDLDEENVALAARVAALEELS